MDNSQPNRVWKVASRWSNDGNPGSCILDIFRNHNIVFVGNQKERFSQIQEGDVIAVSSGLKLVGVGEVTSKPCPITQIKVQFSSEEMQRLDYEDQVMACHLTFKDIPQEQWISYEHRGSCHSLTGDVAERVSKINSDLSVRFETNQEFEIQARSCTLLHNSRHPKDILWKDGLLFRVPIYQRPYSWKQPQIQLLLNSLLSSFLGVNGRSKEEPMFIGTMQLSEKKPLQSTSEMHHEIIDGQQRITTLILLLKVLKNRTATDPAWVDISFHGRLATAVSGHAQQALLDKALQTNTAEPFEVGINQYLEAMLLIKDLLDSELAGVQEELEESNHSQGLNIPSFVRYIVSRVYFVVIETQASLSKTLQIFDSINTSGMDLNGGDIFKVRYYEYLRQTAGMGESVFEEISELYRSIDHGNEQCKRRVCSIEDVLSILQHVLISRHKLSRELHKLGSGTFFERFFDVIIGVRPWKDFAERSARSAVIRLDEIRALIDARFRFEAWLCTLSPEARGMMEFIWWSRYSKHWYLVILFRELFNASETLTEKFILQLSKLFMAKSISYRKARREVDSLVYDLLEKFYGEPPQTPELVIQFLKTKTIASQNDLSTTLMGCLEKPIQKRLACRLSAYLEDLPHHSSAETLLNLIFNNAFDVEHIKPCTHPNEAEREKINAEWRDEIDGIGNLVLLDSSANRSIHNYDYATTKVPVYRGQPLRILKWQVETFPDAWDLAKCKERKVREADKLVRYLCGETVSSVVTRGASVTPALKF